MSREPPKTAARKTVAERTIHSGRPLKAAPASARPETIRMLDEAARAHFNV
jgi:hypothetical protein